jgi:Amt family ammonium transporter
MPNVTAPVDQLRHEIDAFYLLVCGALVFMMQAGFALLEAGTIQSKNSRNIMFKNIVDAGIGGIFFWLVGYGVAYGGSEDSSLIGSAKGDGKFSFAFHVDEDMADASEGEYGDEKSKQAQEWIGWFFQYCFAATVTTIVSGAVAERCTLNAYILFSVLNCIFIYPVVVHWVWDGQGWLSAFNEDGFGGGMIDFAGSGCVHMLGGFAGLTAAAILGPRTGRFDKGSKIGQPHSAPLQALGTMMLWVGWYGFNCGSTLGLSGYSRDMGRVAITTTLSGCAGGIVSALLMKEHTSRWNFSALCNGTLGGLVGITAGCSVVEPWAALIIGVISGFIVTLSSAFIEYLKIDDPLDAFSVHGACGLWACIAVGLFCTDGYSYNQNSEAGLFYGGGGTLLGVQIVGVICEIAWVVPVTAAVFLPLKFTGLLRVSLEEERLGLDAVEHEAPGYIISAARRRLVSIVGGDASGGLVKANVEMGDSASNSTAPALEAL